MDKYKNHRYRLCNARPVKLFICPRCNKKDFKRYVDTTTGQYVDAHLGRCNRQQKCGYHAWPEYSRNHHDYKPYTVHKAKEQPQELTYIPPHIVQASMQSTCKLRQWLYALKGEEVAKRALAMYHVGSSKHWQGATVFWQVDAQGNTRTGKVMLYNDCTGKRVRQPFNHIHWAHSLLMDKGVLRSYNLQQCMFGEHLLSREDVKHKPIGIVESEKTAIIATMHIPEFVWMACGSLNGLDYNRIKPLKGRQLVFFPDKGCVEVWQEKVDELQQELPNIPMQVNPYVEDSPTPPGSDLADYLLLCQPAVPQLTPNQQALQKLISKNPAISKLVGALGLEVEEE